VRYVQTIAGTTPSFTRAINRLQISNPSNNYKQLIDRSINPNTLNSVTPSLYVEGCQDFNVFVRCSAQTTGATLTLQFSDDNTNWHTTANTLTTVVGFAHLKVSNEQWKFARVIASGAGTGITLNELTIKAVGK
jgi:P pilus assembly chaperone PapD